LRDTNKGEYVTTMKKADLLIPCVSAASIVAKVARDNYMVKMDKKYKGYNFKNHVGYGTAAHNNEINQFGATKIHRMSFSPLKNLGKSIVVTTKQIGDDAETVATKYLKKQNHEILERNWKTKFCEIDIVSKKDDVLYFTEVKYRKNVNQGDGLSAITSKKLRQMQFAAKYYVVSNEIKDIDQRLSTISLSGQKPVVDNYLEIQ
jgi:ribonuclease HII